MKRQWLIWTAAVLVGCLAHGGCGDGGLTWRPFGSAGGDEFTIHLYRYEGADHAERVVKGKDAAEKLAGWKGVFIVHEDNISTLYWGRYASRNAARDDLRRAKRWRTPDNNRPFQLQSYIAAYPGDEPGKAEWNLRKARGAYTVLVEVYFNDKMTKIRDRKRIAAQRCEELRDKGEQAYYYHGPANSLVTIGLFDESAIKMTRKRMKGGTREVVERIIPQMRSILMRHPYLYENGRRTEIWVPNLKTGKPQWIDRPTYPVRLPGSKGAAGRWRPSGFGGRAVDDRRE